MTMIAAGRRCGQVALAQAVLPDDMRRHPGIGRIGEIAVPGAANESAITRRIEPADGFAVGNDRCRWGLHFIDAAAAAATTMTAVTAPVAVVLVVAAFVATAFVAAMEVLSATTTAATAMVLFVPMVRWCR